MRVFVTSQFNNQWMTKRLIEALEQAGHEVRSNYERPPKEFLEEHHAASFLSDPRGVKLFREEKKRIEWCDAIIMVHAAGRASYIAVGYAKGLGKLFYIWGKFDKKDFEPIYGLADRILPENQLDVLLRALISVPSIQRVDGWGWSENQAGKYAHFWKDGASVCKREKLEKNEKIEAQLEVNEVSRRCQQCLAVLNREARKEGKGDEGTGKESSKDPGQGPGPATDKGSQQEGNETDKGGGVAQ